MCKRTGASMIVAAMALTTLTGCDPLTRDRFQMIDVRTSTDVDVRYTLGQPTLRRNDQWHYQRPDRHLNVIIDFDTAGVVTRKQWIDAATGEWLDTEPSDDSKPRESTTVRTID
ncbi:MAG: hypothetical protein V3W34_09770 [Phycisphaerae bacterium]